MKAPTEELESPYLDGELELVIPTYELSHSLAHAIDESPIVNIGARIRGTKTSWPMESMETRNRWQYEEDGAQQDFVPVEAEKLIHGDEAEWEERVEESSEVALWTAETEEKDLLEIAEAIDEADDQELEELYGELSTTAEEEENLQFEQETYASLNKKLRSLSLESPESSYQDRVEDKEEEDSWEEQPEHEGFEFDIPSGTTTATRDFSLKGLANGTVGNIPEAIRDDVLSGHDRDLWNVTNRVFWDKHPNLTNQPLDPKNPKHRAWIGEYGQMANHVRAIIWLTQIVELLDKYRGNLPREFLLGWMAKESDGRVGVTTSLGERGYFQIHPDEARDILGLKDADFRRTSTNREFSIQQGIRLVQGHRTNITSNYSVADPSDLLWQLTKARHGLPGLLKSILDRLKKDGKDIEWAVVSVKMRAAGDRNVVRNVEDTMQYASKLKTMADLIPASPVTTPELSASEPDDSWETSVAELETAGPFDSELEPEPEQEATSDVKADDNAEQGSHEFEQDQEDRLSWDHRVADEFETEAAGFEESVFQDDLGREEPGPMEFHIPKGSASPTLGFEFDLNYGFEDKVTDAKGLSPPAGYDWPREGLKATDHEGRSGSSLKDGFVVTMDAVRLEISTVPFVISNDAEFKSISDGLKNFGQELISAPKTFESGLVVPGVSGHPTTFTHPRTVVNKPEIDAHGDIAFPGDRDHAAYKLASVPLVIHRLNRRYPTRKDLWASPQATLTLPLSQFGKLVWLIHETKGGPGEAFTSTDRHRDRLGLRDDLAWIALKRAVAERKKKIGTFLSDGSQLTEADFTCVTPLLTILLMYMLTSIIIDPEDAEKEGFAKGSLPLNIKTPLWQIHKFALSDRERLVLHELYTDPGKRTNLFALASGKKHHQQGKTKLFPAHTHADVLRFLDDVPTWHGLIDALVKEKPVVVTKDNRIEKKGHLKGNEILIAPLSSKIDWSKTEPNIAVEMRRIGFAPVPFSKWPDLMKRIRDLAKIVNS